MLSIINNYASVVGQNSLTAANDMTAKSIQRLSSGLRINSAADDPSGLAISERLRTQINGLGRASMNAQDAISFMQTGEGALNETHSILQRMRELSIQAANGTLTASDRQEIQHEVGQLKDEVDRIAYSTEFNTKKLLNGDGTGLWSSSSDKISAVLRGRVAEGNYELEITSEPGKAQVLKTDIFEVKSGLQTVSDIELNGTAASLSGAADSVTAGVNIQFDFNGFEYTWKDTSVVTGATGLADAINSHEILSRYVKASVLSAGGAVVLEAINDGEYANSFKAKLVDTASGADLGLSSTTWSSFTGGTVTESGISKIDNPVGIMDGFGVEKSYVMSVNADAGTAAPAASVLGRFAQGTTDGFAADSTISNIGITISTVKAGGAYAMVEFLSTSRVSAGGAMDFSVRFSFDEGKNWTTMNYDDAILSAANALTLTDGSSSIVLSTAAGADLAFNSGDKILVALNDFSVDGAAAVDSMRITAPVADGMGATTSNSRYYTFVGDELNKKDTTLEVVQLDVTKGEWYTGSVHLDFGTEDLEDGELTFDVVSGGAANSGTKLKDIGRFYDDDGNFVLGESGKYLTIYNGSGTETKVYVDGEDTIEQFTKKLNDAIATGLGMGVGDLQVDSHLADFVEEGVPGTDGAVEGTILIRSTMAGEKGKIYFSADEEVLNALSLATIQEATASETTVIVRDAHTQEIVGSDTVSDGTLHNVIEGIDVDIDPRIGTKVSWTGNGLSFSKEPGAVEYLHVVDNAKSFQIGANQNQTMDSFIGQMDAHALGVDRVLVVSQDTAQKSIGYLDEAIDRVSGERARIGAVMNRLEHTINNLNVQQENAIASESRIRDLDVAKSATEMAKYQILNQASTSMLAQANQMAQGLLSLLR